MEAIKVSPMFPRTRSSFVPGARLLDLISEQNVDVRTAGLTLLQLGSTTVGITTPHGTILAVEKRVPSPLIEASSIEKIMEVDKHIGCAMSGLTADARTMVDHARVTSQMHNFTYDEPIGVESCTQAVCDLALRFGESVEDDDALMVRGDRRIELWS